MSLSLRYVVFIHDAKEESIQTILEMAEYKKAGSCKALIVTGCLAQRYKQEIIDEIEEVGATSAWNDFLLIRYGGSRSTRHLQGTQVLR